jgi:four helix bundle protein
MSEGFRDLIAWQKARHLVKAVYLATARLPEDERFGLTSQMRRAAVSVPRNIAEGQAHYSDREFVHFLRNARGSLAELETQFVLAMDLELMTSETGEKLVAMCNEVGRILNGLIAAVSNEKLALARN